jgi:basic membrane protein A
MEITRRRVVATAAGGILAASLRPALSQTKFKVAGAHASPVENAWNSRLHDALKKAAAEGKIDYVFSRELRIATIRVHYGNMPKAAHS